MFAIAKAISALFALSSEIFAAELSARLNYSAGLFELLLL